MEYIVNYEPFIPNEIDLEQLINIENKIKNKESITSEEVHIFLNNLVYLVRYKINADLSDYTFKCDLAQSMLYHYLKDIGCNVMADDTQRAIIENIEGHSFVVLELNVQGTNAMILLDPTYIQFFKSQECSKENYMIINNMVIKTPKPGYFIQEIDKNTIEQFLRRGYMVLNESTAQIYGNSFYNTKVAYYLDENNKYTFKSIPGSIYINAFVKGNSPISKSKEELQEQGLSIESIVQIADTIAPKL